MTWNPEAGIQACHAVCAGIQRPLIAFLMFEVSCKHYIQDITVKCSKHSPLCDAGIQRRGINLKAVAPVGNAAGGDRASLAAMRSKVMPTQEKFDPVVYLGTVHWVRLSHAA